MTTQPDDHFGDTPFHEEDYEEPKELIEVQLSTLPQCSFCEAPAEYDFRTVTGQWGYGCFDDWVQNRMYTDLGMGKGQKLVKA
jgi:hypothetical protein